MLCVVLGKVCVLAPLQPTAWQSVQTMLTNATYAMFATHCVSLSICQESLMLKPSVFQACAVTMAPSNLPVCVECCSGWCGLTASCSDIDPGPRLAALPLPKLCPVGFVFIWAEKEHISTVVKQARNTTQCYSHASSCCIALIALWGPNMA